MPYCIKCGASFSGPGAYCDRHSRNNIHDRRYPYNVHEHFNYNSDSTDPTGVHLRTPRIPSRRTRFAADYEDDDLYDSSNNHFSRNNHHIRRGVDRQNGLVRYGQGTSNIDTSLTRPLVHTFNTLSREHAISSMKYTVAPNGNRSVIAEANTERERCHICKEWFPDTMKLEYHQQNYPAGCEEHGKCMTLDDAVYHASRARHDRCFVQGCRSHFRREGNWKNSAVVEHIEKLHYY